MRCIDDVLMAVICVTEYGCEVAYVAVRLIRDLAEPHDLGDVHVCYQCLIAVYVAVSGSQVGVGVWGGTSACNGWQLGFCSMELLCRWGSKTYLSS